MKNLTLVFFVLCFVLALSSCKQDSECTAVSKYYVSSVVKNFTDPIAPLTGTDTLKFLFNGRDTQVYVGQGVQIGSKIRYKVSPDECTEEFQYLIYNYKCINYAGFAFRMEYHPYSYTANSYSYPSQFYFKGVDVGSYMIHPKTNDSIHVNGKVYYEPYYRTNGPDTAQYFMLCNIEKNTGVRFLKIKYIGSELTLLK